MLHALLILATLAITNPGLRIVDEDATLVVPVDVRPDSTVAAPVRVHVEGLPPGARYDAGARAIVFRPDFIQGGRRWSVTIRARQGARAASAVFPIEALDTIRTPEPVITSTVDGGDHWRLTISQPVDGYLEAPSEAGRRFRARVVVPKAASATDRRAVRIYLHGIGGAPSTAGQGRQFAIYPHDPDTTYWWGRGATPYTLRRVLALVEWVLERYDGADPERVHVAGSSMGGAGAATLGLLFARHFCFVEAVVGQTIPRNHRPARLTQLQAVWGSLANPVWDRLDLTRALRDDPEARAQFIATKHGKDDPTIHFGAVTHASPLTGASFYDTLQARRIGHYAVWDEGGHGTLDPVMGAHWWDRGWSPALDSTSYLRRDLPFPAFTRSSLDGDPGDGSGNGRRAWHASRGYAGDDSVRGDTGWAGDVAGARNRHLRWNANAIVDGGTRLEMPLRVLDATGSAPPRPGYPTKGNRVGGALPAVVDVTIRRAQRFRPEPGELVRWSFGAASGTALADADGAVTIPRLALGTGWTTLVLER